jgi:hypothetical protein
VVRCGTSNIYRIDADGTVVYKFRGANTINQMGVTGYHRVAPDQCEQAQFHSLWRIPSIIAQFYLGLGAPTFRSLSANNMCGPGGYYAGEGGQEEPTNRGVPGAHFDCVVLMGGGGAGGGGGGSSYVTITTCHYSAYFNSNGTYSHSELEYCTEETFVIMT